MTIVAHKGQLFSEKLGLYSLAHKRGTYELIKWENISYNFNFIVTDGPSETLNRYGGKCRTIIKVVAPNEMIPFFSDYQKVANKR